MPSTVRFLTIRLTYVKVAYVHLRQTGFWPGVELNQLYAAFFFEKGMRIPGLYIRPSYIFLALFSSLVIGLEGIRNIPRAIGDCNV